MFSKLQWIFYISFFPRAKYRNFYLKWKKSKFLFSPLYTKWDPACVFSADSIKLQKRREGSASGLWITGSDQLWLWGKEKPGEPRHWGFLAGKPTPVQRPRLSWAELREIWSSGPLRWWTPAGQGLGRRECWERSQKSAGGSHVYMTEGQFALLGGDYGKVNRESLLHGAKIWENTRDCEGIEVLAQPDDGALPELFIYSVETVDTSSLERKEYGFEYDPYPRIKGKT